jgi:hypothetical protein
MSEPVLVFVNERPVSVAPGTAAVDAVRQADGLLAEALATGRAYLTDGRGIRLDAAAPVTAGAIVRVVRSARAPDSGGRPGPSGESPPG